MLETIDHGTVRELRLARPPANAINPELMEKLVTALNDASESAEAIVISGRPGMFTAGLDVPELLQYSRDQMLEVWHQFLTMLQTVACLPVPSAIAITGHAPAGGIVLALFGDYRIMPRGDFITGLNEVQVGLVVSPVIHRALERAVGPRTAEKILVTGKILKAEQALEIGLIDELADDPDDVVRRAVNWCEQMLAFPRLAMTTTRSMVRSDLVRLFDDPGNLNVEKFVNVWYSESSQAALRNLVQRLQKK
jgi:enoyl-CoA hydratase/carnithine racemase